MSQTRKSIGQRLEAERAKNDLLVERTRGTILRRQQKMALGDYRAARQTRLKESWIGISKSADAHLDPSTHEKMRAWSQRAERNSPVARAIAARTVDLVSGGGPVLRPMSADGEWNREVARLFGLWAEHYADVTGRMTLGQLCDLLIRRRLVDGDVAVVRTQKSLDDLPGIDPVNVGSLQLIESARIVTPAKTKAKPTNKKGSEGQWVSGVKLNDYGGPLAYGIAEYGPGGTVRASKWREIAAEDVMLLAAARRIGQTRGEPGFCAVDGYLDQLDRYIEATVIAARVGACQALVIRRHYPADAQAAMLGTTLTSADGTQERLTEMRPGMVHYLSPGEELEQVNPLQPAAQFDSFVRMMLRLIGTDMDLPVELLLLDYSQANFYGQRAALAQAWIAVERQRRDLYADVLGPVYRWVVRGFIDAGLVRDRADWAAHKWIGKPRPSVDPEKEVKAAVLAINNNLLTRTDALAERGLDYAETVDLRAEEVEMERVLGVTPVATPGAKVPDAGKGDDGGDDEGDDGAGDGEEDDDGA